MRQRQLARVVVRRTDPRRRLAHDCGYAQRRHPATHCQMRSELAMPPSTLTPRPMRLRLTTSFLGEWASPIVDPPPLHDLFHALVLHVGQLLEEPS